MATSFSFGTGTGGFGAKSSAPSAFSFGTGTTAFGAKSSAPSAFSFGTPSTAQATTGFSFSTPASTTGTSLFGAKTTAATTSSVFGSFGGFGKTTTAGTTGFSGFGKPATTSTGLSFGGFGKPATSSTGLSFGGFGKTSTAGFGLGSTTGFGLTASSASTAIPTSATAAKPLQNPKDENVPKELSTLVSELEAYVKKQKEVKDEITKLSSQEITKLREEISTINQSVALVSNRLQRHFVSVQNLKSEVSQELKNAEIAHGLKDRSVSLHHNFTAPMEFFQQLVFSFESRISCYRSEIEELETFLSSSGNIDCLTPQNLLDAMKRLNESFIGLASDLQNVHEFIKVIKEKYIQFRRIVYNDTSNPFGSTRKYKEDRRGSSQSHGPSPFPVVQGAGIMANAIKNDNKASVTGFSAQSGFGSTFGKTGLTRSLSAGNKTSGLFGNTTTSGNSSLLGKSITFGNTTPLNLGSTPTTTASSFSLQKPPSGKRGKIF